MGEISNIHESRIEYGSKYIDLKVKPDGVAIVTIRTRNEFSRLPQETTILYRRISEQLQALANLKKHVIEQHFSTRNQTMKKWVLTTGKEMGFTDYNDDGRVLMAVKRFYPQQV